jgi:hypothetical protein
MKDLGLVIIEIEMDYDLCDENFQNSCNPKKKLNFKLNNAFRRFEITFLGSYK